MHSIIFAKDTIPSRIGREVRVTEKINKEGTVVYSRRRISYKVMVDEFKEHLSENEIAPQIYIYKNIQDKRKFFSTKIVGLVEIPKGRGKSCLFLYEHSFWMLIKDEES